MKQLLTAAILMISINTISLAKIPMLDSVLALKLEQKLISIQSRLHEAYVKGKINVYQNDSLNTPLSLKKFNQYLGNAGEDEKSGSMGASLKLKSDFTSFGQIREISCISPMYNLIIDGQDLGMLPMYYVAVNDLSKVLDPEEIKLLAVLFNLAETNLSNNTSQSNDIVFLNGEILHNQVENPKSIKMTNWVYGHQSVIIHPRDLREITQNSLYALEEKLNNVLCNSKPNMSCFLDKKLKREVSHLGANKELAKKEVIQIPSAKYPGEYEDTTVYNFVQVERISQVQRIKKAVQIDFWAMSIFMKEKEFDAIVPEWIQLLLIEND